MRRWDVLLGIHRPHVQVVDIADPFIFVSQ